MMNNTRPKDAPTTDDTEVACAQLSELSDGRRRVAKRRIVEEFARCEFVEDFSPG